MTTQEQRLARWGRLRERGASSYVVRYGVLLWGISSAILVAALRSFLSEESFLPLLAEGLIVFPLAGILWGTMMWRLSEAAWQRQAGREKRGCRAAADELRSWEDRQRGEGLAPGGE